MKSLKKVLLGNSPSKSIIAEKQIKTTMTAGKFEGISPDLNVPEGAEVSTVAAGCFWGVEHIFRKTFGNGKGLIDAKVGYSGGESTSPNYKEVCTDTTGRKWRGGVDHMIETLSDIDAEALEFSFDPKIVSYDSLLDFFFRMHDPTTINRQGPDTGSQYRSAIFTHNEEQTKIAEQVKERMQKTFYKDQIVTRIVPFEKFWDAETYHQLYLKKNPTGYECPSHFIRTKPQI